MKGCLTIIGLFPKMSTNIFEPVVLALIQPMRQTPVQERALPRPRHIFGKNLTAYPCWDKTHRDIEHENHISNSCLPQWRSENKPAGRLICQVDQVKTHGAFLSAAIMQGSDQ